jgi:type IV secretion system protein TrbJ
VQVKAAEATAMQNAQTSAEAETRKVLAQQEAKKISNTFKPRYECLLQYVSEQSLAP